MLWILKKCNWSGRFAKIEMFIVKEEVISKTIFEYEELISAYGFESGNPGFQCTCPNIS
jgi:hypothetical protein